VKKALLALVLLAAVWIVVYGYTVTRRERLYRQYVMQGDRETRRGDDFAAVVAFTDAIALKPDSMLGYLKRGEARRRRADLDAATEDFSRATVLDPANPRTLELLGDVEAARQRHDRAADHYGASVKLDDLSPRVLYKLGLSRHLGGHYTVAAEALTSAIKLDSRFAEAHYMLGVCLRDLNKPREAEDALERAVGFAPSLIVAREQLADLYGAVGRRAARIAELDRLLSADPSPARQVTLALAHASAGDTLRAVRLLRSGAGLYPDNAAIYLALGRVWLDLARVGGDRVALSKALEALQHAVSMEPSSEALTALGRARLAALDPALAERTLRQATETLPADPAAFLHLAEASERTGRAQAARRALLDYTSLVDAHDARRPGVAERVADLWLRIGEPRVAVQWYASASEGSRATPALLARLAQAQLQAGDTAGAHATLTRILDKDPDDAVARAMIKKIASPIRTP